MAIRLECIAGAAVCCLVPVASGAAQQVTGVVHQTPGAVPVVGAVVLLVDSSGRAVARTITDPGGRYRLSWQPAAARLRVVRIGFRPASDRVLSGVPHDTSVDVELDRLPAMLTAVRVTSDAVCSDSPDRRGALALWEQARAGLLAAIIARDAAAARMTNLSFERRLDARTRRVTHIRPRVATGSSNRPFLAARSGDELARLGYTESRGKDAVFFAPDADVLLDESFASAHCFSVQRGDDSHRGLIGLGFEPRVNRRREVFVDVRGVLWLDPELPALSDLEFRFTGVHPLAARVGAGGTLRFQTMTNGVAFIAEWTLALPVLIPGPAPRSPPSLVDLSETGGIVLDASWPDGASWKADIAPLQGSVTERGSGEPIAGAVAAIEGLADSVTADRSGRFTFGPLPEGTYSLDITDTTFGNYLRPRTVSRNVSVKKGAVADGSLELPSRSELVAELCKDRRSSGATATMLGRLKNGGVDLPSGLAVESSWQANYTMRTGESGINVTEARQAIDLDSDGTFRVCGVAHERPVRLRLRLGRIPVADTVVTAGRTTFHLVDWALRAGVLAAAQRGDASSLAGSVVNESSGAPIGSADVWLVLDDVRVNTDSSGRFAIHGLSPGRHLVQVRRIGYAVRRDTITLFAGAEADRQFRLTSQAVMLDTVRTIAEGGRYISPALRGFEERRATGQGHFIAEDELRKNDNRTVPNVLRRIPGIMIGSGRTGEYAGSTRGGGGSPAGVMGPLPRADSGDRTSPRGCWVAVYLDGIPIYTGPPQPAPDLARMQVRDFAAVEFYAGGATMPVQFSQMKASDCGVLLLWTRER